MHENGFDKFVGDQRANRLDELDGLLHENAFDEFVQDQRVNFNGDKSIYTRKK